MIIAIKLLLNQYQANNWHHAHCEGLVDWPPAPWRILRAIVAGSYNVDLPSQYQETLKGLLYQMAQAKPEYYLPKVTYIQHRSPRPQLKLGKLPQIKPGKTLYAAGYLVDANDTTIYIRYPFELSETQDLMLRLIFNGLTYLGRKESAAQWQLVEQMPEANAKATPEGTQIVATADPNLDQEQLWKTLHQTAADVFAKNKQAVFPGVTQTAFQVNTPNFELTKSEHKPQSSSRTHLVKLEVIADYPVPLKYSHQLCYNLHCCLVKYCQGQNPVFTGQEKKGQPCQKHGHTFIQPIPDSQNRYVERLQLISTDGYFTDDLAIISTVEYVKLGEQFLQLQLSDFSKQISDFHQQWQTVTPMFLTRFPQTLRGKPRYLSGTHYQKDGPTHQALKFLQYLDHLGLSGAPSFQATDEGLGLYLDGELAVQAQSEPWDKFWEWQQTRSHGKKVGRVGYNINLNFSKPVQAPLGLGYACHYGLGTLLPF